MVVGAFAAHQDYLDFPFVVLCGFVGAIVGDVVRFALGRWIGKDWLVRRPLIGSSVARATDHLERYPNLFVVSYRFLYGVRLVAPIAIGFTSIPAPRFIILSALSAAVWAVLIGILGYLFGDAFEAVFGDIRSVEVRIIAGAVAILLVIGTYHLFRRWTRRRSVQAEPDVAASTPVEDPGDTVPIPVAAMEAEMPAAASTATAQDDPEKSMSAGALADGPGDSGIEPKTGDDRDDAQPCRLEETAATADQPVNDPTADEEVSGPARRMEAAGADDVAEPDAGRLVGDDRDVPEIPEEAEPVPPDAATDRPSAASPDGEPREK